jgi:hypothetical protein
MADTTTTSSQLSSISGMVERIGPLAPKTRGMPIRAEDWNLLIGVLADLLSHERTQETTAEATLEARFAPRVHKHIGEIGMESLDADLLARLADGGVSLATRLALADAQKQVAALGSEAARLSALAEDQRAQIDRVSGDALERENRLREFSERFDAIEALRGLVSALTAQVDSLGDAIKTVLDLRESLRDEHGNPIDAAALAADVERLDGLSKALLGIDGKLVRMRDVELALQELRDAVGVGAPGALDKRIETAVGGAEERLDAKGEERAGVVGAQLQAALGEARAALDARMESVANELRQHTDGAVAGVEERLSGTLAGKLEEALATLRSQLLAAAGELVDARVGGVRSELLDTLAELVADAVKAALADLDERIDRDVDEHLAAFEEKFREATERQLAEHDARWDEKLAGAGDSTVATADEHAKAMIEELRDELMREIQLSERRGDAKLAKFREAIEARVRALEIRLGTG